MFEIDDGTFENGEHRNSFNSPNVPIFGENSEDRYKIKVMEGQVYSATGSGDIYQIVMGGAKMSPPCEIGLTRTIHSRK